MWKDGHEVPAVLLSYWNLRRLFRARVLLLAVVTLPAVAALFCGQWFALSGLAKWTAFALMAIVSVALVQWQVTGDSARGLTSLVRILRSHKWIVECAAFASFAVIFVLELTVFVGIRTIVH